MGLGGLKYTGHPIVDVGLATMAAFADKAEPGDLTESDLDSIVDYVKTNYTVNPLKSFLTVAFPNSGFTNPSFESSPEKRVAYADRILNAWKSGNRNAEEPCVFTGLPSAMKAYRQHIPLLTGEGVVNFYPHGDAGLPVSGIAILAIHVFPLGCAKVAGRLFAVHSDQPFITRHFAGLFLEDNRKAVLSAQAAGISKLSETGLRAGTLLIDKLLRVWDAAQGTNEGSPSVTAYHLSNSGQGVDLTIHHLPLEVSSFLRQAMSARYRTSWDEIRQRGWQIVQAKKRKDGEPPGRPTFNVVYEDALKLPDGSPAFIRRYFLRLPERQVKPGDPRATYSFVGDADLVSYDLTELFLREVMNVNRKRIALIKELGDTLADYVLTENDRRFFQSFMTAKRDSLRSLLIRVSFTRVKRGQAPLVTFDGYVEAFDEDDEGSQVNWRLARDLVLIRMIERLHQAGWVKSNAAELAQEPELEEAGERETV